MTRRSQVVSWGQVAVGDQVIGADGQAWRVERIDHALALVALVEEITGQTWSGTPAGATVERVVVEPVVAEHIAAGAVQALGATVLGGPWPLPPVESRQHYTHPGVVAAHLAVFHGVDTSAIGEGELVAAHAALSHAEGDVAVPHHHQEQP